MDFTSHAKTLVQTLEQARQDVGLPAGFSGSLTLAGRIALWEGFLPRWADWMRRSQPRVSLRLVIGFEEDMMQGLVQGTVDVGVMYTPQSRPGLAVERLFDDTLVLVGANPDGPWPDAQYVHIDWGPEFFARFSGAFPDIPPPAVNANIGWLGIRSILEYGGSGYFPLRITRGLIAEGRLHPVAGAPQFSLPAYMVTPLEHREAALQQAVEGLREFARQERALLGQ